MLKNIFLFVVSSSFATGKFNVCSVANNLIYRAPCSLAKCAKWKYTLREIQNGLRIECAAISSVENSKFTKAVGAFAGLDVQTNDAYTKKWITDKQDVIKSIFLDDLVLLADNQESVIKIFSHNCEKTLCTGESFSRLQQYQYQYTYFDLTLYFYLRSNDLFYLTPRYLMCNSDLKQFFSKFGNEQYCGIKQTSSFEECEEDNYVSNRHLKLCAELYSE